MSPLSPTKVLSREEVRAILESVNADCITRLQKRVMLETLVRTGIRTVELVNLRADQIEWPCESNHHRTTLHLTRTKGSKPRNVPVPEILATWLREWRNASELWQDEYDKHTAYFFHQISRPSADKPYSERTIRDILVPLCEKAIGRHVNLHMLRHTCATNLVEAGIPLPGVQRMLGHSNITTTMVYVDVRGEVLAEQVRNQV